MDYVLQNDKIRGMVEQKFIPGETYVPVSGKVFDEEEINNAIEVAREGWWTEGKWTREFEKEFKKFLGVNYVSLVNSGSSANLVALASLTSKVFGERRLKKGDEFITTAVAFPTTVNPGIQYGLTPVFVDCVLNNLNIDVSKIEKAITFPGYAIHFYPTGIISSGTVYLVDKKKKCMYALSNAVSQVSYLRLYRYDGRWKLISE